MIVGVALPRKSLEILDTKKDVKECCLTTLKMRILRGD